MTPKRCVSNREKEEESLAQNKTLKFTILFSFQKCILRKKMLFFDETKTQPRKGKKLVGNKSKKMWITLKWFYLVAVGADAVDLEGQSTVKPVTLPHPHFILQQTLDFLLLDLFHFYAFTPLSLSTSFSPPHLSSISPTIY